jgi:hypothetical protein
MSKYEKAFILFVAMIFVLIVGKYGYANAKASVLTVSDHVKVAIKEQKFKDACGQAEVRVVVQGGYLDRDHADPSIWLTIYDTYPLSANGKEAIYGFLDNGSIKVADQQLKDYYTVDRFDPVKIKPPITWQEDPYIDKYWRFIFYSLRPSRHLLFAWRETGERVYRDKLLEVLESFLDDGMDEKSAWDDYHAVAFRTLVLTNTWWKLREKNALPVDTSTKILKALKKHGDFLADSRHYEAHHNHGINQAAALFLLATNFPDIPGAQKWLSLSRERLSMNLNDLVDDDGVLVENAPYYHFYALRKYWEICNYSKLSGVSVSKGFDQKIDKMLSYGTYILQPNLEVPLLGASLRGRIGRQDMFKTMAASDPNFLYVLTQGKKGTPPSRLNVHYPTAGQTIMRSGWGKGKNFANQTQIIFDVGPYRTNHSDYDALSFSLYGAGIPLMPDSGLYSYEEGPYKSYFHGTRAHNTVVVDGVDQHEGAPTAGAFIEGKGFVTQSAQHQLYDGVIHERAIALLGKNIVLIADDLISERSHNYEQAFHLFPEAKLNIDGVTVTATGSNPKHSITIRQLLGDSMSVKPVKGQTAPPDGFLSYEYKKAIPNYSIAFTKKAKSTSYLTLLEVGERDKNLKVSVKCDSRGERIVEIRTSNETYSVRVGKTASTKRKIKVSDHEFISILPKWATIEAFDNSADWQEKPSSLKELLASANGYQGESSLRMTAPIDGSAFAITKSHNLDLSDKNIVLRMRASNIKESKMLSVDFSTNNWRGYVSYDLRNAYRQAYENDWLNISLGRGLHRESQGKWQEYGSGFDWSKIDKIGFRVRAAKGAQFTVDLDKLVSIPGQEEGSVVICFDDGHATVLDAAKVMRRYGLKGNIAVISERPDQKVSGFLTLEQLKQLQNDYGWNMVNHSAHHKNVLDQYFAKNDLEGFEKDMLEGAEYLIANNINSAPNWYIYPNGANNAAVKKIVKKYYKFARSVDQGPEVFPFGDNMNVKIFLVGNKTRPEEVSNAVLDAVKHKQTLILVLHRLCSSKSQPVSSGYYDIDEFETIMRDIAEKGIKVRTFSEFDKSHKIPITELAIKAGVPEQVKMQVDVRDISSVQKMVRALKTCFQGLKVSQSKNTSRLRVNKKTTSFCDDFERAYVLEEASQMGITSSEKWWLNSGARMTIQDGIARTVQGELPYSSEWRKKYALHNPDETDDGRHPQNIFRLVTLNKWQDFQQQAYFRVNKDNLSASEHRKASNGLLLFNRYLDSDNLYYAGIRVDGAAVIKKKLDGEYHTLALKPLFTQSNYDRKNNASLLPKKAWVGLRTEIRNQPNGTVNIKLFVDLHGNGRWCLALDADDSGNRFGREPILSKGHAGIRTDFMDVEFDDYQIEELR